jgi:hypothetical protein
MVHRIVGSVVSLESNYLWPTGVFRARAEGIEARLPQWGHNLYHAVIATQSTQEVLCMIGSTPQQGRSTLFGIGR